MDQKDLDALATALAERLSPSATPATFRELSETYMEAHSKPHKKTWRQDRYLINFHLLPAFGDLQVIEINSLKIAKLHGCIGSTAPYAANRAVQLLGGILKQAQGWGFYPEDKVLPTARIKLFPEESRARFVTPQEMPALGRAINSLKSRHHQVLFWLYLFTGLRKSELLRAKWADLDTVGWTLKIPNTKNGRQHEVALCAEAMAMLARLPRRNEFIFPGTDGHLKRFDKAWNRVRRQAGLQDIRLHDLRRTVGSWLARSGTPMRLVGDALNQKSMEATEVYTRFLRADVKAAFLTHSEQMKRFL